MYSYIVLVAVHLPCLAGGAWSLRAASLRGWELGEKTAHVFG